MTACTRCCARSGAKPGSIDVPTRVWRGWLLVVLVPVAAALEGRLRVDLPLRWLEVALFCVLAPVLLWRRTRPLLVLVVWSRALAVRPRGAGFGLGGMAERTHLLGGTFDAGPGPERGWAVTAALPRRGPA